MKPAILVVDDDTAVCELLQDVLSEHVFSVLVCHNGQDALRRVQQDPNIALVLLDMMLPDINGLQVLLQQCFLQFPCRSVFHFSHIAEEYLLPHNCYANLRTGALLKSPAI